MKIRPAILGLLFFSATIQARENPYDALGKMLEPWESVLAGESKNGPRAVRGELVLIALTGMRPELAGAAVTFAIENPDKFFLRAPVVGEQVAICRDGQRAWASPGKIFADAIAQIPDLPKLEPGATLGDFALPVSEKQLVFLPALFQVTDQGDFDLDGKPARVLDVALMPAIAKSLKVEQWRARVWLRADHKPARLEIAQPGWRIVLGFQKLEFAETLPAATWQPTPEQQADLLQLDAAHVQQLLELVARGAVSKTVPSKKRATKSGPAR